MMERRDVHHVLRQPRYPFSLTILISAMSGCATVPVTSKPQTPPAQPQADRATPASPDTDETQQTTLAAVEEFLERTQQYHAGAVTPPAAHGREPRSIEATVGVPKKETPSPVAPDQAFANAQVTLSDDASAKTTLAIPAIRALSIRAPDEKVEKVEPATIPSANAPLDVRADDGVSLSERLISQLRTDAERAKDWQSEWRLRLLLLAFEHDAEAVRPSAALSEPTRTMLDALVHAALAVRNSAADPLQPADEMVARVEELRRAVGERAEPKVGAVALCRKVVTFGVYEEMPAEDLVAGRSIQTIVYSEIANLRSKQTDDGQFETRLATRLEVLSTAGESLWQRDEPEITDRCRTRRTDFFLAQRITLPPTLPAAEYVLKLFVEDKLAGRAHEATRTFTVASPISVARGKP
jgi:hypothetical protein